jgi:hypothetical protein
MEEAEGGSDPAGGAEGSNDPEGGAEGSNDPRGGAEEEAGSPDGTLGGYLETHHRPPAFEGEDGHPYTVSVEVERTANLPTPFSGYLVFPRWADTGLGVVDHLETATLFQGRTRGEVERDLTGLTLADVRRLLDEAIERRENGDD